MTTGGGVDRGSTLSLRAAGKVSAGSGPCWAHRSACRGSRLFGLHEWSYGLPRGSRAPRKVAAPPFRLEGDLPRLVEENGPRCTHYDAFRFFTRAIALAPPRAPYGTKPGPDGTRPRNSNKPRLPPRQYGSPTNGRFQLSPFSSSGTGGGFLAPRPRKSVCSTCEASRLRLLRSRR